MKSVLVTTSWDDGHILDMRLAALLKKYGLKGTFYVSPHDHEFAADNLLSDQQVTTLAKSFEIGAHTMTHPRLTQISDKKVVKELADSKQHLERVTGTTITAFCYPGGNYAAKHIPLIKKVGFAYARTTKRLSLKSGPAYEARTTVNTYNHYQDLWKISKLARFQPRKIYQLFHWEELAKFMFDKVQKEGGIFHLWGHSWEVDGHNDWEKLEAVFEYISGKKDTSYVTNGELPALETKNLLMVAPYFPPHTGGQEFYAYNNALQLQKKFGWNVTIATSGGMGWRVKKREQNGLTVYELPYWHRLSNTPINPLWYFMIRRLITSRNIDVLNTHAPVVGMAECAQLAAGRVPVVFTYHMLSMKKGEKRFDWIIWLYEKLVLPLSLKKAHHIIVSSDPVRQTFLKNVLHKSQTISTGVDSERFYPCSKRLAHTPTLLFNGTLNKTGTHKGLSVLIDALPLIIKKVPMVDVLIIGAGDGHQEYQQQADKLGVGRHLVFLGTRFDEELVQVYQSAHIFVQPSLNDSYPMALVEALATGMACVATSVGALPAIVEDGVNGLIVPPGDTVALAEKLIYLFEHPAVARKFGAAGRRKAEVSMSWDNKVAALDVALHAAIDGRKGRVR